MHQGIEANREAVALSGLSHRVFISPKLPLKTKPRIALLVHGRSGDSSVMWPFARVFDPARFAIIAPQAPLADPSGGYSWWIKEALTGEPSFREAVDLAANRLRDFVLKLPEIYPVELSGIVALGFSQGGAVVGELALREGRLFSGIGLLASFLPKYRRRQISAPTTAEPRTLPKFFIAHGTEDEIVPLQTAEEGRNYLLSQGVDVRLVTDTTKHKVGSRGMKELSEWIGAL